LRRWGLRVLPRCEAVLFCPVLQAVHVLALPWYWKVS